MIYVLYGLEDYLINKEIKKIMLDNNLDDLSTEKYDLSETPLEKIIDGALTTSLFSDKKMIIAYNAYIFGTTTKKTTIEHNLESLDKYIENINENTILVFTLNSEKLDERKKQVKKLKEKGIVKEFNKENNINNIVLSFFDDYKITNNTITKLINRVGTNLQILENEANKLKLYKENKVITDEDIEKVTNKNIDMDIFNLIDNIVLKNKSKAIESYNEMIKHGEEPIKILIMLASQFRLMFQCKLLYKKGYTEKDIAGTLKIHPYRVKLALEKGRKFTDNDLLKYLDNLAELDSKIKQSEVDKKLFLELFILKI